jgi:hypothetical protein
MIERTVLEYEQQRFWSARRRTLPAARLQLRESDRLMAFIEECRVHHLRLVPADGWRRVVFLLGAVDPRLSQALGIHRDIDRVEEILYRAQSLLMRRNVELRRPRPAKIIPLFSR